MKLTPVTLKIETEGRKVYRKHTTKERCWWVDMDEACKVYKCAVIKVDPTSPERIKADEAAATAHKFLHAKGLPGGPRTFGTSEDRSTNPNLERSLSRCVI